MALNSLHCAEVPLRNCSLTLSSVCVCVCVCVTFMDVARMPLGTVLHSSDEAGEL